jgi:hypothetical protein
MAGEVNIVFRRRPVLPGMPELPSSTPFDKRCAFWGIVKEIHPETNTVDVITGEGFKVPNVRVGSRQWVTLDKEKGFLSGERDLPPENTMVLCLMPNGEYSDCAVIGSGFALADPEHAAFKEDSEEAKFIDKGVDNAGWKRTFDKRTGTVEYQNAPQDGEETVLIEIDQQVKGNEKAGIKVHGTLVSITKDGGISIQTDKKVILNGGGKEAARKGDPVESTAAEDPALFAWFATVGSALNGIGAANTPPASIKAKITAGSGTVEIGD